MLVLAIVFAVFGIALASFSLHITDKLTKSRDFLITANQRLVNMVMDLDTENYRLSIAAGEIEAPPGYYSASDVPIDPPGNRNIYRDMAMEGIVMEPHPYGDKCVCRQCIETFNRALDDAFSEDRPNAIPTHTEIIGVGGGKHAQPIVGALHPGSKSPHGDIQA